MQIGVNVTLTPSLILTFPKLFSMQLLRPKTLRDRAILVRNVLLCYSCRGRSLEEGFRPPPERDPLDDTLLDDVAEFGPGSKHYLPHDSHDSMHSALLLPEVSFEDDHDTSKSIHMEVGFSVNTGHTLGLREGTQLLKSWWFRLGASVLCVCVCVYVSVCLCVCVSVSSVSRTCMCYRLLVATSCCYAPRDLMRVVRACLLIVA